MHQNNAYNDPRSTVSRVEPHNNADRPAFNRGRSNTFSTYRPYQDALYYNEPIAKLPPQAVPQRRRHSMQRRGRRWEDSDSDSSDSSDDDYNHHRRSHSRPRGRTLVHRPRARHHSTSTSSSSRSRSRSRTRRHHGPNHQPPVRRPAETYTLTKALKSAAMAATVETIRCRAEPGPWHGQKGQRVAVAAASGAAMGSLRNGRLQKSGKLPYAEAAMTGAYSVDFLKRVLRQTEYTKDAEKEKREWEIEEDVRDERRRYGRGRSRSRSRRR